MTFARSIDPIVATEHSITRMAVATEKELESQDGDLEIFFKALEDFFEYDRSAARGQMATRALWDFEHATAIGNACRRKADSMAWLSATYVRPCQYPGSLL